MAYPATIIALDFVKKGIAESKFVTQMKLQKLVYFAHGYHLAKYKEPLILEQFKAWQFGPVIPEIYQEYKYYGSNPITDPSLIGWLYSIDESNSGKLAINAQSSINYTWQALKDLSGYQLSNWTHKENSPWSNNYKPGIQDIPIPNDEIGKYFSDFLMPK